MNDFFHDAFHLGPDLRIMDGKNSELARDFEFRFDEIERHRGNRQDHSQPDQTLHAHHHSLTADEKRSQPAPGFTERFTKQNNDESSKKTGPPALIPASKKAPEGDKDDTHEPGRIGSG